LIAHVSPIQLAIRLLVPEGSRLLELDDLRRIVRPYSAASLTYPWHHPQPEVDRLQRRIERLVGTSLGGDRREVFDRIWQEAHAQAGITPRPRERGALPRAAIPYLNEPWYC
jgi:hypothetical protein